MQPILIIEDNQDLINIYRMSFENYNVPIVIKDNALDAIAEIKKINPSLILLDLLMPGIDGINFLKMISENNIVKYPTIICSNLSSKETIDECMALGCIDFIIKSHTDTRDIVKKAINFTTKLKQEEVI